MDTRSLFSTALAVGALYMIAFAVAAIGRAVSQGRGLIGVLLAETGTEIAARYAQQLQ